MKIIARQTAELLVEQIGMLLMHCYLGSANESVRSRMQALTILFAEASAEVLSGSGELKLAEHEKAFQDLADIVTELEGLDHSKSTDGKKTLEQLKSMSELLVEIHEIVLVGQGPKDYCK